MKRCIILSLGVIVAGWLLVDEGFAWRGGGGGGGRGGGGGGGGGRAGGGGGFQGGAPPGGVSGGGRPAAKPAAKPAAGGGRTANRSGSATANRGTSFSSPGGAKAAAGTAGGAAGGRASVQPGTRPAVGSASGQARPGTGAATRPAGATGGAKVGAGATGGAKVGAGAAVGAGVAAGQRAGTLPGLGGAGTPQGRAQNLAQASETRASSLQDRMAAGGERQTTGERQGQRQDAAGERQQSRQDYGNQSREDWQNWAGEQGDWYHGAWSGGWYAGAAFENYPVAASLGVTAWGVNRMSNAFGMGGYSNPYGGDGGGGGAGGGYDYSEPIAPYQPTAEAAQPEAREEGMTLFDQSREAFAKGDYEQALELCNQTLKTMPNDTVVHEFRALALFALKNYSEAAAGVYAVLSAGPGWDWTTLSSLYGNVADYTTQLRALESFVKKNPKSSDAHFLLAYHYLTAGHPDAAQAELHEVDKLTPNDRLVTQLLTLSSKPDDEGAKPTPKPPPADDKLLKAEQVVGAWTAGGSGGSKFQMTLNEDSTFAWKFTSGKKSDEIKGVFAVEQNNLALEVDDGSVMLAEIALTGNQLHFKVIGGEPNDPGLTFAKAK